MRLGSLWRILCPVNRPNRGFLGHRMRISGPGRILCPATRPETLPNRDHTAGWSNKQLAHNRHHRPLASRKLGRARGAGHRRAPEAGATGSQQGKTRASPRSRPQKAPGAEATGSRQGKARASPRRWAQKGTRRRGNRLAAGKRRGEPAEQAAEGRQRQERRARK